MATIYDMISAPLQARRWEESALERRAYLGEGLVTTTKQLGNEFSTLSGKVPTPVLLDASSYDAKVLYLKRDEYQVTTSEIPYFKNAMMINEKDRQELLKVMATGNAVLIDAVVNKIYNDNRKLLEAASIRREQLRMMLLTTGKVSIASNGQKWEFDYAVPSENKPQVNWTETATADPVADIIKWQDAVEVETGVRPSRIVMNTVTFNLIGKTTAVLNAINANSIRVVVPTPDMVRTYVETAVGATIYLYNNVYKDESGAKKKFVPDNVVVLFGEEAPIEEYFGTTPEEADLMSGATDAQVSIVDTGVAVTTWKEIDPVNVRTKVSMTYIPTLTDPNSLVIADVAHGA